MYKDGVEETMDDDNSGPKVVEWTRPQLLYYQSQPDDLTCCQQRGHVYIARLTRSRGILVVF
jgi:hypothetical protein